MSPIYAWNCAHCLEAFESFSKPNEPVQCPKCRTYEITRKITAPATYIRGSGDWSTSQKPDKSRSTEK